MEVQKEKGYKVNTLNDGYIKRIIKKPRLLRFVKYMNETARRETLLWKY